MQPELWEIGLDGMIGGNGSYVEHHGQVLMHQTDFPMEDDSKDCGLADRTPSCLLSGEQ